MRLWNGLLVAAPVLISTLGCAGMHEARYVYQDGEYGVVGIPENTNVWPDYYRDQAEALMKKLEFEGLAIVVAKETSAGIRLNSAAATRIRRARLRTDGRARPGADLHADGRGAASGCG